MNDSAPTGGHPGNPTDINSLSGLGGHIDSYYAATVPPLAAAAALDGSIEVEICVIGAGLAGLTAARELARAGRSVALIEARRVGWAASGRNGGFVAPGFAESILAVEARVGRQAARALWDLTVDGADYVRAAIGELGAEAVIGGHGRLKLYRYADPDGVKASAERMNRDYGTNHTPWNQQQIRAVLKSERYFGAVSDPSGFHIHPLAYAQHLASDAVTRGLRLFETTPAIRLAPAASGGGWLVTTPGGAVAARHVVLAGNVGLGPVSGEISRAILPVATYVVVTEPLGSRLGEAIGFAGAMGDTRRAGDYYRIVGGDRLLWGGKITTRQSVPPALEAVMTRAILSVYPQLAGLRIAKSWIGHMGYTVHKMPLVGLVQGEAGAGVWAATAFGGHGLNTTAMAGALVADAIAKGDDRWRQFEAYRPRWAGGVVGRVATQLEYWRLQLMDRIEEARARGVEKD